jgi:hypothetical protein
MARFYHGLAERAGPRQASASQRDVMVSTHVATEKAGGEPVMLFINHSCEPNVGFAVLLQLPV